MMYAFESQLREGVRGEAALDDSFAADWIITLATDAEQRRGVDRHFIHRATGEALTIEYKTDYVAGRTRNAFLEIISVDVADKPGWVYSCTADYLFYYVPADGVVYVLRPARVRHFVDHLSHWRRPVPVSNRGYRTWGYVVPLRVLERLAVSVVGV